MTTPFKSFRDREEERLRVENQRKAADAKTERFVTIARIKARAAELLAKLLGRGPK